MIELYADIPEEIKNSAKLVFDLAMMQPDLVSAVKMLDSYTNSCINDYEKEFCDFYFNMRMEQLKDESNPNIG